MSNAVQFEKKRVGASGAFPLLATGYHLSAEEFHRAYEQLPEEEHAELIEGIVYMASPISALHGTRHAMMIGLCSLYSSQTPGTEAAVCATIRLDGKNEYEPDGHIRFLPEFGGQTRPLDEKYLSGGPEFIFEISNTTLAMDLHEKFSVYERNGVQEYVVWQVKENRIELFALVNGAFKRIEAETTGVVKSRILPGLWLNVPAMLAGAGSKAFETVQEGLTSSEHANFVKRLRKGVK